MKLLSIVVAICYIVAVSAGYSHNFDNFIDYSDDIPEIYPSSYHENSLQYGQVITAEPYYASSYDYVKPVVYKGGLRQSGLGHSSVATSSIGQASMGTSSTSTYQGHRGISLIKTIVFSIIKNAPALIAGFLAVIGVCKLTPICSNLASVHSLSEVPSELVAFVTPERIHLATDFVKEAVRKYRSIQNS